MGFSKLLRLYGLIGFALPIVFVTGCGKPTTTEASPEIDHIRQVMLLGFEFYADKSRAPKNLAELRDWAIKEKGAQEDDFKSTRDGQEYLIGPGMMGGVMVAEQTGKGGIRYGTNPGGSIQEVDEKQVEGWLKGVQSSRATGGRG